MSNNEALAKKWQGQVDYLDSVKSPDHAYRDILSTGSKDIRKGQTWRGKVLEYIKILNTQK